MRTRLRIEEEKERVSKERGEMVKKERGREREKGNWELS